MDYYIAWWNVENLFARKNDPDRPEWLATRLAKELDGWTQAVVNRKISQLAGVIAQMNSGSGPDILGVCEIENRAVLQQLVGAIGLSHRRYKIAHHNMRDKRGIDVAFIYDSRRVKTSESEWFDHVVLKRNATRDLFQVNFYTRPGNRRLICIGNHWPSRLGGVLQSEPYRILAAETLSYWLERIKDLHANDPVEPAVLVVGDFNDEPASRSLVEYALSERVATRVKSRRSTKPYLLNLMWPLMGQGVGTHYYEGLPGVLDQILVNRPLLRSESPLRVRTDSAEVLQLAEMRTTKGPKRFGRPSNTKSYDETGFSDHYPISVVVREDEGS